MKFQECVKELTIFGISLSLLLYEIDFIGKNDEIEYILGMIPAILLISNIIFNTSLILIKPIKKIILLFTRQKSYILQAKAHVFN